MKENREVKNMLRDAGILLAITLTAGLILGFVYELTKAPIEQQQLRAKNEACREVFEDAAGFEEAAVDLGAAKAVIEQAGYSQEELSDNLQKALGADGSLLGYVLTVTTHEGYGGDIKFTMGVRMDGTLNGISILSISETPGLGMKADPVLKPQFAGKRVESFEYTKTGAAADNQIDAITSATITTNAVTNGVNAGLAYFNAQLKEGGEVQ